MIGNKIKRSSDPNPSLKPSRSCSGLISFLLLYSLAIFSKLITRHDFKVTSSYETDHQSYGIVGDADGHSQRVHRPYLSLTTSRFVILLPSTYDNRLIKYLHINSIFKKGMFLKVKGGKFNCPVQGWGSTCRFDARSECGQRVRSINRIAPQGSHRYSWRGHNTIVLHPSHST